jgi:tRNA modification GTPase
MDTIYALSSAPGRAGVAVVRVSGPGAARAIEGLTGKPAPEPRKASLSRLRGIDQGLVLFFRGPESFTGEDVAEFQIHGGRATVDALLTALAPFGRPAEPGEFTRRAVENGKLDLTRAEAIADLIDAQTDAQRRQALRQYDGALCDLYEGWRAGLVRASAWAEVAIDFADEDLPTDTLAGARVAIGEIFEQIQRHLDDAARGELLREGLYLTVVGPPNAGKSSLVNALARRDVAIVAETAGTTRDVIEVRMDLGGYPVTLADTAGLRAAGDAVEAEGVRRALARAGAADLVLLLLDATSDAPPPGIRADLTVWNKADVAPHDGLAISVKTGAGLDTLVATLTAMARDRLESRDEAPALTRKRHRHALEQAADFLQSALSADEPELLAEDLRLALRALGRITGRVDIEELLDVVFRDFCIGK